MDHNQAVKEFTTERYLLDELPREKRAAFEEHFFDCPPCAEDVKIGMAFIANAREILAQETGGSTQPLRKLRQKIRALKSENKPS